MCQSSALGQLVPHDVLLSRWQLTLELFGRVFVDDVGAEPGSVISELGGFPVKEVRFRRDMEKLRNSQQRDLTLPKVSLFPYCCSAKCSVRNGWKAPSGYEWVLVLLTIRHGTVMRRRTQHRPA